jgi:integrase
LTLIYSAIAPALLYLLHPCSRAEKPRLVRFSALSRLKGPAIRLKRPKNLPQTGFPSLRSVKSDRLLGVIERQLAHAERNKVRAAYNRAQYMAERRTMMAAWADYLEGDYLDTLRDGAVNVVPLRSKRVMSAA